MANRRMISRNIVTEDKFTAMCVGAQHLYMLLILHADDEGFVANIRMLTKRKSYINALLENGYIYQFDSGVAVIRHWLQHNSIRRDRKTDTTHTKELNALTVDTHGVYHLRPKKEAQPKVTRTDFEIFWEMYPNKNGKDLAQAVFATITTPLQEILEGLENHKKSRQWCSDGGAFIPRADNWLSKKRWKDRLAEAPQMRAPPPPLGATGALGEVELRAIQKALAEGKLPSSKAAK